MLMSNKNSTSSIMLKLSGKEGKRPTQGMSYSSVLSHFIMLPCKIAEKLIFNSTKIDRLLAPYCYHTIERARRLVLLLVERFSIQKHVISQDLHFFRGESFSWESV